MTQGRTLEEAKENLIDAYVQLKLAQQEREARKIKAELKIMSFEAKLNKKHKVQHIPLTIPYPPHSGLSTST